MWNSGTLLSESGLDPSSVFLAQAWGELLHPSAPDSFQARHADLTDLLDELQSISRRGQKHDRWKGYIKPLQAELENAVEFEREWLSTQPRLQYFLDRALRSESASEIIDLVAFAKDQIGDPVKAWSNDLTERIKGLPKEKHRVISRLATLATRAKAQALDLDQLLAPVCDDVVKRSPAEVAQAILETLEPKERDYHCLLAVNAAIGDVPSILKGHATIKIAGLRAMPRHATVDEYRKAHSDYREFITLTVRAHSGMSAARKASAAFANLSDILNFFTHGIAVRQSSVVLTHADTQFQQHDLSSPKLLKLAPRSDRRRRTMEAAIDPEAGAIASALEQYTIALGTTDSKVALANLWTALETLVGQDGPDTIGARVAYWVAPIVALRRLGKIATYLSICAHHSGPAMGKFIDRTMFPHSSVTRVSHEDVFAALCGPTDNPKILALFKACEKSPLLCYRLFQSWQEMHEPRQMAKRLEGSRQRVEWQISRIYRERNLIVHHGENTGRADRLIFNLHYYFSMTTSSVLTALKAHPGWTVPMALRAEREKYSYVVSQLKVGGTSLTMADLLHKAPAAPTALVWPPAATVVPEKL